MEEVWDGSLDLEIYKVLYALTWHVHVLIPIPHKKAWGTYCGEH
jgi:hypothetical protein